MVREVAGAAVDTFTGAAKRTTDSSKHLSTHTMIRVGVVSAVILMLVWEVVDRAWPSLLPRPGWSPASPTTLWAVVIARALWEICFLCSVLLLPIVLFHEFRTISEPEERRRAWLDTAWVIALYAIVILWLQVGSVGPHRT